MYIHMGTKINTTIMYVTIFQRKLFLNAITKITMEKRLAADKKKENNKMWQRINCVLRFHFYFLKYITLLTLYWLDAKHQHRQNPINHRTENALFFHNFFLLIFLYYSIKFKAFSVKNTMCTYESSLPISSNLTTPFWIYMW